MGNFGPMEMLVIAIFGLLIFGPQKLPEMARTVARAVKEFKKVTGDFTQDLQSELDLGSYDSKSTKVTKSGKGSGRGDPKAPEDAADNDQKPEERKPGPR